MPPDLQALATALEHHQAGRLAAAEQIYRQILASEPNRAEAWHLLGVVAHQMGQHEAAIQHIGRAIGLRNDAAEFYNNLGEAYRAAGRPSQAVACYRQALTLEPDFAGAHTNQGIALKDLGKLQEAVACHRRALQFDPGSAAVYNNLGNALIELGSLDGAVASFQRALELMPGHARAHNNLGNALKEQGRLEDALVAYRRALELAPALATVRSNMLVGLQYAAGVTAAELAAAHADYDRRHAAPLRAATAPRIPEPIAARPDAAGSPGRLRLGFVSPDLAQHPVGNFLIRVLAGLRDGRQETVCYSDRIVKDLQTRRLQVAAAQWRDVAGLSDERLAQQIRDDRIDILFDLAGHTAHNRLLVLARKPAPLQITWMGYEGTTGLSAINYLLADRYMVPAGTEQYYREQVLRTPEGYVCWDPPATAPPVGPLPASQPGELTLGSFNNLAKITPEVVQVWAAILRRLPKSRLVMKYRALSQESVQQRYRQLFADCGVDPERLTLLPASFYHDYLTAFQAIDLALDPFPFSGSATTCEALWMGVPVVTCPGETFASRHSLSHLSNVGLTETIARDLDDYVDLAVALAHDLPRLAAMRAALRPQMAASPLCDGRRFAANLMELLRDVWQRQAGRLG